MPKKKTTKKTVTKVILKNNSKPTKQKDISCNLKQCLNCENNICDVGVPNILSQVKPNSIKCKFFDEDFDKTWKEIKNSGGVLGIILRSKGKRTEEELQEAKKGMRKPRADKGKKRKND